ncbi:MAG: TlpA disulfide reductase family protein [Bryobacteraceae bacterium]|jgi:peroxiredoxin
MIEAGEKAPQFALDPPPGAPWLLVFLETDCPTCRLSLPYLNKLAKSASVIGVSQDSESETRRFMEQTSIVFPVTVDGDLSVSRAFDPAAVPAFFLIGADGRVMRSGFGFDKDDLNGFAAEMGQGAVADPFDGAPARKPGCSSRHLEPVTVGESAEPLNLQSAVGARATRIEVADDAHEYCMRVFGDALPVVPPTVERVERMMAGRAPSEVIGRIPPCYGEATVEKIAANAVMAGCLPEIMRVLLPLVRAICDERFNAHGVQATTHFAAPLIIVNGPIRRELGFASGRNVFSNVVRANSTLGRALQLLLLNVGGGRPDGIDMSALGNPGKFSYCIAENEEENPWEPLHVERGFDAAQSTVSLFAGEAPHGVSEHMSRSARGVLKAISRALATVWSYRTCMSVEAVVVLCPEHVKTIHRDGFSKHEVREFLFQNTGIPVREYDEEGEGTQSVHLYRKITIDGTECYQKFRDPESIKIVVAGGTAGKFSAVIGSWNAGPRGSQMVTYPCL